MTTHINECFVCASEVHYVRPIADHKDVRVLHAENKAVYVD